MKDSSNIPLQQIDNMSLLQSNNDQWLLTRFQRHSWSNQKESLDKSLQPTTAWKPVQTIRGEMTGTPYAYHFS